MEVKLLRHTPEPEKTVAMSARLCYSPVGAAQLEETMSDECTVLPIAVLCIVNHTQQVLLPEIIIRPQAEVMPAAIPFSL